MTDTASEALRVYLIAGEESGDRLGAPLMRALRAQSERPIRFSGVGGIKMESEGLTSLFPMQDLAVMGLAEVLPRLPRLIGRMREVRQDIRRQRPDALVTIDAPDFCFRISKRMRGAGIPLIHFVAPTVWAWRPGRAKKVAGFLDHLMALLPFEPPYFEAHGLACTYVGHPVLDSGADKGIGEKFRSVRNIPPEASLLAVLPGSRSGEIRRLMPIFSEVVEQIASALPNLHVAVPIVPATRQLVEQTMDSWPLPVHFIETDEEKYDAFAAADTALAASGTVALELALAGTPAIIAYQMAPLTGFLARRLVRAPYASLVNLILEREAVPEFLLEQCKVENIAPAVIGLMESTDARTVQKAAYVEALRKMGLGMINPSQKAAETVLHVIEAKKSGAR